jgi:toxin ParE1/3/4
LTRRLRYNDTARDDLLAITRYIRKSSGSREIANSFATALRNQCSKIAGLPGTLGRSSAELQPNLRSFAFGNYLILFRYTDGEVQIVNVIERHRDIAAEFETDVD